MNTNQLKEDRNKLVKELSEQWKIDEKQVRSFLFIFEKSLSTLKSENNNLKKSLKKSLRIAKQSIKETKVLQIQRKYFVEAIVKSQEKTEKYKESFKKLKDKVLSESKNISEKVCTILEKEFKEELGTYRKNKANEKLIKNLKLQLEFYGQKFGFSENNDLKNKYEDSVYENFVLKRKLQETQDEKLIETFAGDAGEPAVAGSMMKKPEMSEKEVGATAMPISDVEDINEEWVDEELDQDTYEDATMTKEIENQFGNKSSKEIIDGVTGDDENTLESPLTEYEEDEDTNEDILVSPDEYHKPLDSFEDKDDLIVDNKQFQDSLNKWGSLMDDAPYKSFNRGNVDNVLRFIEGRSPANSYIDDKIKKSIPITNTKNIKSPIIKNKEITQNNKFKEHNKKTNSFGYNDVVQQSLFLMNSQT